METGIISFNVKVGRWWNIQIHLNLCLIWVDSGGHRNVPRPRWSSWPRTNCSSSNEACSSFILPGTSAQDGEETYSNSQDIPKYWKSASISVLRSQQRPLSCFGVMVKLLVLGRKLRRRTLKLTGLPQVLQKHHLKTQNTAAQCPRPWTTENRQRAEKQSNCIPGKMTEFSSVKRCTLSWELGERLTLLKHTMNCLDMEDGNSGTLSWSRSRAKTSLLKWWRVDSTTKNRTWKHSWPRSCQCLLGKKIAKQLVNWTFP